MLKRDLFFVKWLKSTYVMKGFLLFVISIFESEPENVDKSSCLFYLCQQQCLYLSHDDCLLALLRDVFSVSFWQKVEVVFESWGRPC